MKTLKVLLILSILAALGGCAKKQDNADLQPVDNTAELKPTQQDQIQQIQDETSPSVTIKPISSQQTASYALEQNVYTVKKGDTLWSIAKTYLGDGQRWKDIVAANPGLKPEAMSIGQKIVLPAK